MTKPMMDITAPCAPCEESAPHPGREGKTVLMTGESGVHGAGCAAPRTLQPLFPHTGGHFLPVRRR